MPEFLTTCEKAVREAGRVLLEKMGKVRATFGFLKRSEEAGFKLEVIWTEKEGIIGSAVP